MSSTIKLYDLPRDKGVKLYGLVKNTVEKVVIFGHIDGMYSYCWLEQEPRYTVHISANTELKKYKDGYKVL